VRVIQCRIFIASSGTTGIAVLTSSYRVFMVTSITEPRIRRMAEIPGQALNGSSDHRTTPHGNPPWGKLCP